MNGSGDQQETIVRASGVPEAPGTGAPQATTAPAQSQPRSAPLGFLDRVAAFLRSDAGKVTLVMLAAGVAAAAIADSWGSAEEDEDADSSLDDEVDDLLASRNQLNMNRTAGARYERAVAGALEDTFDGAEVLSQVIVTTPDGRTRRPDNVLRHRNGAMTAVEIKNVREVTGKHVQQAEDHREGLRHTFGARAGKTILVVPDGTVVNPEHESRVRVRTFTPKRG